MEKSHLFALSVDYTVYKHGAPKPEDDEDEDNIDNWPNISEMATKV